MSKTSRLIAVISMLAGALLFVAAPDAAAEVIDGTDGPDVLIGNDGEEDQISGFEGDDTLRGGNEVPGDGDLIIGGEGDDTLEGGGGYDELIGDGHDCHGLANGEAARANTLEPCIGGEDTLNGGVGDDLLIGDGLLCDNGFDLGGDLTAAAEQASCSGGDDTLNGGDDADLLIGDLIECGFGRDNRLVRSEAELPTCEGGDDTLNGGVGADLLFGDEFPLFQQQVCDVLFLNDAVVAVDPLSPMVYDLCGPVGGDDILNGGADNDYAEGGGGDDEVNGGTGNDFLLGDNSPFLLLFLDDSLDEDSAFGFGDFDPTEFSDEELEELFYFLLEFHTPSDGNDIITGDAGSDILAGNGGHDVVCGDQDDIMLVGGPGTDVPCPVFNGLLDATDGPVSGDLSAGIRELDDEFAESGPIMMSLEGNGELGEPNAYEFVITKEPTKGTVVFDPLTGEFTYTPDEGATGLDDFEYTLRRKIIEQHANGTLAAEPGVNDDGFLYSITQIVEFFLGDPPPPPPAVQPRAIAQVQPTAQAQATGAQLPATGMETTGMALMGLGLLLLGALAFAESQRRETALMRSQARHLTRN